MTQKIEQLIELEKREAVEFIGGMMQPSTAPFTFPSEVTAQWGRDPERDASYLRRLSMAIAVLRAKSDYGLSDDELVSVLGQLIAEVSINRVRNREG